MDPVSGQALEVGRTLGHYRLLERIGAGGMGEVWRARDERLERNVALKVLLPGTLADEATRKRFRREALSLSKLNHPNIATVFDFDSDGGHDFIVMEHVSGMALGVPRGEDALLEAEVVRLGLQLAEGLAAAHGQGIVHRDLKPANLRLTADGRLKILDFGLAHLAQPAANDAGSAAATLSAPITQTGALLGTPAYMAPEQLRGEKVDARTDLWAAGLVLHELATGRRAYERAGTAQVMYAILNEPLESARALNPRVSRALEAIVLKCAEKDPTRRYASASGLAADLRRLQQGGEVSAERARVRSRRLRLVAMAAPAAVAAALVAVAAFDVGGVRTRVLGGGDHAIRSIAVLPLANLSGDPNQEYFADGMTEELITTLAQIGALKVISRGSIMTYKGTKKAPSRIARELGVEGLVEGTVLRVGDRVRITSALVRAATGQSMWAEHYERDLKDVLTLQNEVSRTIADRVQVALTPGQRARLAVSHTVNPEAHEACIKGRWYLSQGGLDNWERARGQFERAISTDPAYAPAYAGLAHSYEAVSNLYRAPTEVMPKAQAAVSRALALDSTLAEAWVQQGYFKAVYEWRWNAADEDLRRALELNPNDVDVHLDIGYLHMLSGRFDDAIAENRRAMEIDPLSVVARTVAIFPLYESRQYDRALEAARALLSDNPDLSHAHFLVAQCLLQKGLLEAAVHEFARGATLDSANRMFPAFLAYAKARAGDLGAARAMRARLEVRSRREYVSAYSLAVLSAGLGERNEAFRWLDRAVEAHEEELPFLRLDPIWDPLRADPRFPALLAKIGLKPLALPRS